MNTLPPTPQLAFTLLERLDALRTGSCTLIFAGRTLTASTSSWREYTVFPAVQAQLDTEQHASPYLLHLRLNYEQPVDYGLHRDTWLRASVRVDRALYHVITPGKRDVVELLFTPL